MPSLSPRQRKKPQDRRRSRRMNAPMTVVIANTPYAVENWSLGGVKVCDYDGNLKASQTTALRVLVPTAGPGALFHVTGCVNRSEDDTPSLAISFLDLDTIAFGTLNRYLVERMARSHA
jgi:hypothetical protein